MAGRTSRGMRVMRNRWIITGLLVAAGLLTGPAADRAAPSPTRVGRVRERRLARLGPNRHLPARRLRLYTGCRIRHLDQKRALGHQRHCLSAGLVNFGRLPGGAGLPQLPVAAPSSAAESEALNTDDLGRTSWSPAIGSPSATGSRTAGTSRSAGCTCSTPSTRAGPGMQGPNFNDPGDFGQNTFLFVPGVQLLPGLRRPQPVPAIRRSSSTRRSASGTGRRHDHPVHPAVRQLGRRRPVPGVRNGERPVVRHRRRPVLLDLGAVPVADGQAGTVVRRDDESTSSSSTAPDGTARYSTPCPSACTARCRDRARGHAVLRAGGAFGLDVEVHRGRCW